MDASSQRSKASSMDASSQRSKASTERDETLLRRYGEIPSRGSLLHHQLEKRKYFDSGDFALSKARTSSDVGSVATGREHPTREAVAHPSCPVPSSGNVGDNAGEQRRGEKHAGELRSASGLHETTVPETSNVQDRAEATEQGRASSKGT